MIADCASGSDPSTGHPPSARGPGPLSTWSRSRYAQISRLLDEFLGLSPSERATWLETLEVREPALAVDLRKLLAPEDGRAAGILAAAEDLAGRLAALPATDQSLVGRRIGPYCVHSLLGRGGMGSVWLAERVDGLFARRVALKLVHPALTASWDKTVRAAAVGR